MTLRIANSGLMYMPPMQIILGCVYANINIIRSSTRSYFVVSLVFTVNKI